MASVKFNLLTKSLVSDNILLEAVEVKNDDDYIVNPAQYSDKPEVGLVLKTGPKVELISEGDYVLFSKYLASKYRFNGQDYFVVKEDDIVAYGKE
jgi:chaperonin GroES